MAPTALRPLDKPVPVFRIRTGVVPPKPLHCPAKLKASPRVLLAAGARLRRSARTRPNGRPPSKLRLGRNAVGYTVSLWVNQQPRLTAAKFHAIRAVLCCACARRANAGESNLLALECCTVVARYARSR
jgi:hypothetical protein